MKPFHQQWTSQTALTFLLKSQIIMTFSYLYACLVCWSSRAVLPPSSIPTCTAPPPKSRASWMTSPSRRSASATSLSRVNNGQIKDCCHVSVIIFLSFCDCIFGLSVRSEACQSARCVPAVLRPESRNHSAGPLFSLLTAASKGWRKVGISRFISSWKD